MLWINLHAHSVTFDTCFQQYPWDDCFPLWWTFSKHIYLDMTNLNIMRRWSSCLHFYSFQPTSFKFFSPPGVLSSSRSKCNSLHGHYNANLRHEPFNVITILKCGLSAKWEPPEVHCNPSRFTLEHTAIRSTTLQQHWVISAQMQSGRYLQKSSSLCSCMAVYHLW